MEYLHVLTTDRTVMADHTWTVVQFLEELTVEAVPSSWIEGEYCYWPQFKQEKLVSAIKKCEPVNKTWPQHAIKIFRNATFDDYCKARTKARFAEDCSDLNSGTECSGKRRRIQKVVSSPSSSEETTDNNGPKLPPAPRLYKENRKCYYSEVSVANNLANTSHRYFDQSKQKSTLGPEVMTSEMSKVARSPKLISATEDATNKDGFSSCCFQNEHSILKELKNQNHMIRGILVDVLSEIRELKNSKMQTTTLGKSFFVKYENIKFPIGSEEELGRFEDELKNQDNFVEAAIELSKFGGSNPYNFIKRTLSSLIKDELLLHYSWLGRKGKKKLEGLMVGKLLIRAADACNINFDQKSLEKAIQSFLKRAKERLTAIENKKAAA